MSIIAAGIGAGVGLISQNIQNRYNRRQQDKAFAENKEFWHERFDKESKYNSPVEQKVRMQQAGLNPAMMYKQGAGSGNVKGGGAQGKMADKMNMANLAATSAQTANIVEDTRKKQVEADYIKSRTTGQDTDNAGKVINNAIQDLNLKKGQEQYEAQVSQELNKAIKMAAEAQTASGQAEIFKGVQLRIFKQFGIDINTPKMQQAFQAATALGETILPFNTDQNIFQSIKNKFKD